jgi:nicotinamidase-related amidase
MTTALLIIDVQQALCTGPDACFDIERVLHNIRAVTAKARAAGAPVIFVQHEENPGELLLDSAGWQLADGLDVHADDPRVRKTSPDSFNQTNLHAELQARGVDSLVVCGLQSDFCVDTSVRRALSMGYHVALVADAHSTVDNSVLSAAQISAHHNATFASMSSFKPRLAVINAAEISFQPAAG